MPPAWAPERCGVECSAGNCLGDGHGRTIKISGRLVDAVHRRDRPLHSLANAAVYRQRISTIGSGGWLNLNSLCIGNNGSNQHLTGDIAEIAFGVSYAMNPSFYSDPEATIVTLQKGVWGTLD